MKKINGWDVTHMDETSIRLDKNGVFIRVTGEPGISSEALIDRARGLAQDEDQRAEEVAELKAALNGDNTAGEVYSMLLDPRFTNADRAEIQAYLETRKG